MTETKPTTSKRKTQAKRKPAKKPAPKPKAKPTKEELIAKNNEEILKKQAKAETSSKKAKVKRKEKAEEISGIDLDDREALRESSFFWMTNYTEIDSIISEDIDRFKLTPTERIALLKVQAVLNKGEGRPTKLTDIVKTKLQEYFSQDCTIKEACRRAKIAEKTYYRWKEQDPIFCHEMEFYENYLLNQSLGKISRAVTSYGDTRLALEIATKRDERYRPKREDMPQNIMLVQINAPRALEELTTTPRLMTEVYEPEDVRQRRAEKYGRTE